MREGLWFNFEISSYIYMHASIVDSVRNYVKSLLSWDESGLKIV